MTATTGCLILAVVVGVLAISWKRERNAVLRELHSILGYTAIEHTPLIASRIAARWYRELAECRMKEKREATSDRIDLQTKIAELEQKLLKPDNDEQAVSDLAKLVYQGWHRCNEAASGRFRGHYSKPFIAADGEYELIYRRRGSPDFLEPPEVQAAEHDNVGASACDPYGNGWCGCDVRVPSNSDLSIPVYKPRVRDDEAND